MTPSPAAAPAGAPSPPAPSDATKVYGTGDTEVSALDGVTVDVRAPAASPPSWARRARASRR